MSENKTKKRKGTTPKAKKQLDEKSIQMIKRHLSHGSPLKIAVIASGVDLTTFYEQYQKGINGEDPAAEKMVSELGVCVAQFQSYAVKSALPQGDPGSYKWYLERMVPEFTPKVRVIAEKQAEMLLEIAQKILPTNYYEALLQAITNIDEEMVLNDLAENVKLLKEDNKNDSNG